jgi:hypothetical protein
MPKNRAITCSAQALWKVEQTKTGQDVAQQVAMMQH